MPGEALTAHQHRSGTVLTGAITLTLAAAWAAQHALHAADYGDRTGGRLAVVWATTFLLLIAQTVMYHMERPRKLTPRVRRQLAACTPPSSSPRTTKTTGTCGCAYSPYSTKPGAPTPCTSSTTDRVRTTPPCGTGGCPRRRRPASRRRGSASPTGASATPRPSASRRAPTRTCTSPSTPTPASHPTRSIRSSRPRGPTCNPWPGSSSPPTTRRTCMTRITDLWFVTGQLVDRSAMSAMGSVIVNSGPPRRLPGSGRPRQPRQLPQRDVHGPARELLRRLPPHPLRPAPRQNRAAAHRRRIHRDAREDVAPPADVPAVDARLHDPLDLAAPLPAVTSGPRTGCT
jgi:hyaluronan synthase